MGIQNVALTIFQIISKKKRLKKRKIFLFIAFPTHATCTRNGRTEPPDDVLASSIYVRTRMSVVLSGQIPLCSRVDVDCSVVVGITLQYYVDWYTTSLQ
jgi:hypothetical protein